jgi:hypothetical protein
MKKMAAMPAIATNMPISINMTGKSPLPLSRLDRYARIKSTALRLKGAMILASFIYSPER